jgi:hypothetical protein
MEQTLKEGAVHLVEKRCISCGMPMKTAADFPLRDESKNYCVHCARPDGTMKSYDEALEGMTAFIVHTQGLDKRVAGRTAAQLMAKMPAWQDHSVDGPSDR